MKAKEFVSELFTPGKKWEWGFTGSEEAEALFQVGDVPYKFYAYRSDPSINSWDIEFSSDTRRGSAKFGLTGTGNSAEVMSTVVDILRSFLEKYQGKISDLTFTASEPSRQKLYIRMIQRLLPSWNITQDDPEDPTAFRAIPPSSPSVNEAFTSDVPYTVVRAGNDLFTTKARIGNRDIVFNAGANEEGTRGDVVWEVDFYEKSPGNMTFGKSGSGGELQVFSFILKSLEELSARYQPSRIRFSSHKADENRTKLYQRMISRFAPKLGYNLSKVQSSDSDDIFILDKIMNN